MSVEEEYRKALDEAYKAIFSANEAVNKSWKLYYEMKGEST